MRENYKHLTVEGEPTTRFRVYWCDINDQPYECDAEYDTVAGVLAHKYRADRQYKICIGRKFYTRREFQEWIKQQA
jgi:hypothetical protein